MTIDPEPEQRLPLSIPLLAGTFVVALTIPIVVLGVAWDGLNTWAREAVIHLIYLQPLPLAAHARSPDHQRPDRAARRRSTVRCRCI